MGKKIKILLLEDTSTDAELVKREINKSGIICDILHVENKAEYLQNLGSYKPDIVLSDYSLQQFTGMLALKIAKEYDPIIPFILVTGSLNEEIAVECMKAGSDDYVLKESISRLNPAINSALEKRRILDAKIESDIALQQSEAKYRTIFENVQDVFYQIDCKGTILDISPSVKLLSDYTREEVIGKNVVNFYANPEERDQFLNEIFEKGEVRDYELAIITKKSEVKYVSVNARMVKDVNSESCHIDGALRDITDRKLAEEKIKVLSRSVEQSPAAVMITDQKGIIEYVNPKFSELTGYQPDEVIGKNPKMLKSENKSNEEYKVLWDTVLTGNVWRGEFYNRKKNGEFYWEDASISPITNEAGVITHFVSVSEDINEKKIMIEELITAKEKAEEMNKLKSSFLANMSHELRSPLVSIFGFSEALLKELENAEHKQMVNNIFFSGKRLSDTLNLILDLSKIEAKKMDAEFRIINLIELVEKCIKTYSSEAFKKELSIFSNIKFAPLTASIDSRLFEGIINKLLNNAIKYTNSGKIEVAMGTEVSDNQEWVFVSIEDTGIGISKENINLIFEEFRQVSEGYNRSFEGTGLGLTVVKKSVELMNGIINVKSTPDSGSIFTVKFPYIKTSTSVTEKVLPILTTPSPARVSAEIPNILYVEDEALNRSVMKIYLKDLYVLDFAENGKIAFDKAKTKNYDGFLMDMNLRSELTGLDVTKELRKWLQYKKTPIIAVTAYTMQGDKERILEGGCSHYLPKPFIQKDIISILNSIFFENKQE